MPRWFYPGLQNVKEIFSKRDFDSAHYRQVTVNYDVKLGYGCEDNFTHIIFCHFLNFKHPVIMQESNDSRNLSRILLLQMT